MDNKLVDAAVDRVQSLDLSKSVVLFSGGKDSLVTMDIAKRAGLDKAVYLNSELEFSISRKYVREMGEKYNIDHIQPENDFFEFCRRLCPPSKRLKWCCKVIKLGFSMDYCIKNNITHQITGVRAGESKKRSKYKVIDKIPFTTANPKYELFQVNPIVDWTEQDVWNYIIEKNLDYNPLYDYGVNRVGCWCCPFNTRSEWQLARDLETEKVHIFRKIIKDFSRKLPANYRNKYIKNGWRSFATSYNKTEVLKMSNNNKKFILEGKEDYLVKVKKLMPIISDIYKIKDTKLYFNLKVDLMRKQIRLLLEKTLNCIGCGLCTVICPEGALYLEKESIKVDQSRCVSCLSCCRKINNKLKMGCIARNYKINRLCISLI